MVLSRAIELEGAIEALSAEYPNNSITYGEWGVLKTQCLMLKPFSDITLRSKAEKSPTLPYVVPFFNILLKKLKQDAISTFQSCVILTY